MRLAPPARSILYKTRLPFLVVFNKTDIQSHQFALEWMRDFESFQDALLERRQTHGDEDGPAYQDSLMNSMSLVLDEFYKHLRVRPCSLSPSRCAAKPATWGRRRASSSSHPRLDPLLALHLAYLPLPLAPH